jgi:putative endonuclease
MRQQQKLGKLGENLALRYLKSKGYCILTRNFHSKFGEIDIIALHQEDLVFIEVKTRWGQSFGSPQEAITPWKIQKIVKTGQYFKKLHPELPDSLRLDAVVIDLNQSGDLKRIEIIKNLTS